ncbi:MAG TPA: hypothetical protein VNX28_12105 [Gemmataceae bacterium]|jgi:hypothetical protein|nr:hypothetical protein [Gemmataceae bacterium]
MVNGAAEKMARRDWIMANPWPWTLLGLCLCLASWGMVLVLGDAYTGVRVVGIFLGLVSAGTGVAIRLNSSRPAFLDQLGAGMRQGVVLGLTLLFAFIVVALTILLLLRFIEVNPVGLRLNGLIVLWLVVCPMSAAAMIACLKRSGPKRAISVGEESAALLALGALTSFCGCWALYNPDNPLAWDSMRLFLAVLSMVALITVPLVLVSQAVRRLVISLLILLHFGGIMMAAMSAPPSPWLVQQIWGRVYQPYLEFMYLNNAYHFYAPEPGPASYLWFRMYYEDPQGKLWAHWNKIPDVDDEGWHKNTLALEYQRMLAVTENVTYPEPAPNMYATQADGNIVYAPWYADRLAHSPNQVAIIGQEDMNRESLKIPFHSSIPYPQQYSKPNANCRALLRSYARHVCLEPHPEHANWKIKKVKIYRVVHRIPDVGAFVNENMDPRDPTNYWPYYMGEFDPKGNPLDVSRIDAEGKLQPGDPFLYWMLPILRDHPAHLLKTRIKSWAAKHAGDPDWIFIYDETKKRHVPEEVLDEGRP